MDPKSRRMIFVGYEQESKNYRLFDPETRKIKLSKHVTFLESEAAEGPIPLSLEKANVFLEEDETMQTVSEGHK